MELIYFSRSGRADARAMMLNDGVFPTGQGEYLADETARLSVFRAKTTDPDYDPVLSANQRPSVKVIRHEDGSGRDEVFVSTGAVHRATPDIVLDAGRRTATEEIASTLAALDERGLVTDAERVRAALHSGEPRDDALASVLGGLGLPQTLVAAALAPDPMPGAAPVTGSFKEFWYDEDGMSAVGAPRAWYNQRWMRSGGTSDVTLVALAALWLLGNALRLADGSGARATWWEWAIPGVLAAWSGFDIVATRIGRARGGQEPSPGSS